VRESERERESESGGCNGRHYIGRGSRKYIISFEGSQAVPACLSLVGLMRMFEINSNLIFMALREGYIRVKFNGTLGRLH
jgi:hypothetical protein